MADHFSVIGFKAESADALTKLIGALPDTGKSQPCAPGIYYRWQSDVGAELWIHLAKPVGGENYAIIGVTPFYSGRGELPVRVMKVRQRPADNEFEGAAFVEVAPGERVHECATVALLDIVDYACWSLRVPPFRATAQVAAFPHSLAIFMDEVTFALAQESKQVRFAAESFFASGLFQSDAGDGATFHDPEGEEFRAQSRAFFTGRVLETETRQNPVTGQQFCWALVQTLGGTIDVITDSEVMSEPLRTGMVIQGEFWLCARLVDSEQPLAATPEAPAQATPPVEAPLEELPQGRAVAHAARIPQALRPAAVPELTLAAAFRFA